MPFDVGPIQLLVNHVEMTGENGMEWSMSTEQVLGGPGSATLIVQDRSMDWEPECHWDVQVKIRDTGFVIWRGEIISEPEELPVAFPWRKWNLDCSDYNGEMTQRLVGALDGKTWVSVDQYGDYVNIDPFANSLDTDKKTVKQLLDKYIRVDGEEIGTSTFVAKYLSNFATIYWTYTTLQAALEDLAGNIAKNLQFWIDPDLEFHWVAIPAWYDLAQGAGAALEGDDDHPPITSLTPALSPKHLRLAPKNLGNGGSGFVRMRNIQYTLDGTAMPEQLYVRGSTGYVYNTPLQDTPDPIQKPPKGGSDPKYQLTFISDTTKIWHKLDTGYLSASFDSSAPGGPFAVKYIFVPWDASIHKGGHFWKLLEGPHKGKLVDNDTNFFKYGKIKVEKMRVHKKKTPKKEKDPPDFDPKLVGVGGSGWVGEITQDPEKRQAYLDAPVSSTQTIRDAVGGQVLYRSKRPTLRGSCTVTGVDEWRVGELAVISDDRFPSFLQNRYVVIQRVQTTLIEGTTKRQYQLDWGDGPTSRWTMQAKKPKGDDRFDPAIQIDIKAFDLAPGPGKSQQIIGQLIDGQGGPWKIPGKVVEWTLEVYDQYGAKIEGQGELDPVVSVTDSHGKARTTLTTGTQGKLVYFVFAEVATDPKDPKHKEND